MAEKNKPMKSNLFRFVTLRNPQLIEEKDKEKGFIYHPSLSKSVYNNVIIAAEKDKQLALKEVIFKALKTRQEVKKINGSLYTFSSWLMKNKNTISYLSIKSNLNGASSLTSANELLIWDNLIYQTVNRKSVYVRESLIQMLIANKFLKAFVKLTEKFTEKTKLSEEQKTELIRRAKASVVISKDLLISESNNTVSKKHSFSDSEIKSIGRKMEAELAGFRLEKYETLLSELKKEERVYTKTTAKAYDLALEEHNTDVENILENAKPVLVDEIDSETGKTTQVETYPNLKLPKFSFQKEDPLNDKYLSGRISEESLEILNALDYNTYNNLPEVIQSVGVIIQEDTQILIGANDNNDPINVNVGGTTVAIDNSVPSLAPYCFVGKITSSIRKHSVYMNLGTGYANSSIVSANYTFRRKAQEGVPSTDITGTQIQNTSNNATSLKLMFLPPVILFLPGEYTFFGEMTLDNGVILTFNVSNIQFNGKSVLFSDCCTVKSGDVTVDPDPTIIDNAPLYGVTKLGIADFRRVEQEVCCYVPGEVSHIENILAREYKERSTRTLTSMETTTEETKESEVENLSDTTTTERNEMQSEVASVVNEDESANYGANASVSGKYSGVTMSASAYADFASSSSTSNSNTQAQTYAQEVTERAMERIVQKTTKKRTSRILREFEENNKHGFDNTKGDQHISGVYRWVDKIYKNTLLNYGKRLMYEFAIPEPAKFYKEAIKIRVEEGDDSLVLPNKPKNPNKYVISGSKKLESAKDLTKSNYQKIASIYNAAVPAYPKESTKVSKGFSLIGGGGDSRWKSSEGSITIPKGYKVDSASASVSFLFHPTGREYVFYTLNVGSEQYGGNQSLGNASNVSFNNLGGITDKLGVSFNFGDLGTFASTIVAHCTLTDEAEHEWQIETYNAIIDAYKDRVNEYNASLAFTRDNEGKITFNPLTNRSIEKKELKRLAIDLLATQKSYDISRDNYEQNSKTKIGKNSEFQNHAAIVKFFEQAFEWDIMAYTYYPYFYANEGVENKNWIDLFQSTDAADPIFQAFLQSGMARTVVSVRPGFEDAVNWYMTTGEIWNGQGLVTDQEDDLYVSIAEEMQTIEGTVEGTWETKLPTSLTVLQAGTIGLDLQGLPCDTECDDWALFDSDNNVILDEVGNPKTDNPLKQTNQLIGGDKGIGDSTTTV